MPRRFSFSLTAQKVLDRVLEMCTDCQATAAEGWFKVGATYEGDSANAGTPGVKGVNTAAGAPDGAYGVHGESNQGNGVRGSSDARRGVWGYSAKFVGTAGDSVDYVGVYGFSQNDAGVVGIGAGGTNPPKENRAAGVYGEAQRFGILGVSGHSNGIGVFGYNKGENGAAVAGVIGVDEAGAVGYAYSARAALFGYCPLGVGNYALFAWGPSRLWGPVTIGDTELPVDVRIHGSLYADSKQAVVKHPDGSHHALYCLESPESWFEDFGREQLVDGRAEVQIEPSFAAVVDTGSYHVFLTPEGPSRGLYIHHMTSASFQVREQDEGKSTIAFSYRLVVRRSDIAAERLKMVPMPTSTATAKGGFS